mgnify:CR=1 FL=1
MKPPFKPKTPLVPDPDPLFRFERQTPLACGGRQTVVIALTRKTLGWLGLSTIGVIGAYHNLDTALPLLKRLLLT